jgi:hypothetical protein
MWCSRVHISTSKLISATENSCQAISGICHEEEEEEDCGGDDDDDGEV